MSDLAEFLLARIREAERQAQHQGRVDWVDGGVFNPSHILAECEAKRRIVEPPLEEDYTYEELRGANGRHEDVLRLLALPYADHPDYQPEWAAQRY